MNNTLSFQEGLWSFLSSRFAIGIFLVLLLILVAILVTHTLDAIRIVRNETEIEGPSPDGKKKRGRGKRAPRFSMLCAIDREYANHIEPTYNESITLAGFCDSFRNYAAAELHLYYSIEDVRRFVTGLGVSKLMILQGMSGTGKTSLAYAFGRFLQNDSLVVPVQPMWKERSDIIGYFNEFTKRFNETGLLRQMYEAGYNGKMYITILDEVNISRIEYYFAEFLSLLELPDEDKRYLDVVSDVWDSDPKMLKEGRVRLPANMWFIGTANNDDSTFAISDKVYDRAMIMNLETKCEPFEVQGAMPVSISHAYFTSLVNEAKRAHSVSAENEKKIAILDAFLMDRFHLSFGNRIMRQIHEYVPVFIACGGEELSALDDMLCKKVLRKLESQNPTYVRNSADDLIARIDELFGETAMPQCHAYLFRLKQGL